MEFNINKKYNTIVIDPPWEISLTGEVKRRKNRAKKLPYKTMTLDEIKSIPIRDIANQGCHVYCWTTNKMLQYTFDVLKSWGVNYHLTLVWVKPSALAPCFAYKFATEFLLLGFYGKPMQKFTGMGKLNWIEHFTKAGQHSQKPEKMYQLIKEMSPEPRIDVFSRRVISGFEAWGDETPKEIQEELNKKEVSIPKD